MHAYRIDGLIPEPFAALFALDDQALRAHGMRRVTADSPTGYPCRVSLDEAAPGERAADANEHEQSEPAVETTTDALNEHVPQLEAESEDDRPEQDK